MQALLLTRPDLVEQLKDLMAQRLRQAGSAIDVQAITDEMLYARLQSDVGFRVSAVRYLVEQGAISDDQAKNWIAAGTVTAPSPTPTAAPDSNVENPGPTPATTVKKTPLAPTEQGEPTPSAMTQDGQPFDDSSLNPKTIPQRNPYPNLPSTKALYTQFPEDAANLKRFGSDIFRPDVVGLIQFPMDLPAGPDYVLGPGDTVTLDIWGGVSQRLTKPVDREGRISLPETGPVVVAGLTLSQAQKLIQTQLEPQFHNANVEVSVARLRSVRVYVVGDVQRPGAYDISSLSTPLNALYAAGGPTATGSLRVVKHYRGSRLIGQMDLYDLLLRGVRLAIEHLQPGDTILVPPVGPLVAVSGMVRRPAIYELLGQTELADVLQMAGGVPVSASMDEIKVERIEAHSKRVFLSVKLSQGAADRPLKDFVGSFWVVDGDRVSVAPILPYNNTTVYLEGHVYRPGNYPYSEGMKVTDLIHSYQDVLPEPANHAEIIRLQPPDFHPVTIGFDLSSALLGDETTTLRQFDTVRVFGRYEIDSPKVTINGEVMRAGEYPLSNGMTAANLVMMAGGFKRSAYRDSASLSSYIVESGSKVVTDQKTVKIGVAVSGDAQADVRLKAGDVLTILQIPGWSDIGRSVLIRGEVTYPGSYGINEGEKLSAFLKRVGGFLSSAYPAGTVLERVEVRQLEEVARQELIRRLETTGASVKVSPSTTGQDQAALLQAMQQQQKQTLSALRNQPVTGRLVVTISGDIAQWENSSADISLRAGDVITVPKKPNFVLSYGQVYNPNAITYNPGKSAGWYLRQAGGPTELANKKGIYIVRANGSVVSSAGAADWFSGGVMETKMQPGDVLVVPEKFVSGSSAWKTAIETAQFLTSLALAAAVVAQL